MKILALSTLLKNIQNILRRNQLEGQEYLSYIQKEGDTLCKIEAYFNAIEKKTAN